MPQQKISDKQYDFLLDLYEQQGKRVTPEVEHWLSNLPADQASMYIEKWKEKIHKRRANRQAWRGKSV